MSGDGRWLLALSALPGMGPGRLRRLLAGRSPEAAWRDVACGLTGERDDVARRWRSAAGAVDVDDLWLATCAAGVGVLLPHDERWPRRLRDDPEPPVLLLARGDAGVVGAPTVAVVGTRRCTHLGRSVAYELGRDLAAEGVCVVSGLALGIDGAAHEGALASGAAPPAAVVATGLDVPYPRRNARLWDHVARAGVVLTEAPLGAAPERWRFPARNRIIAALADVVVVVESDVRGGSMHTVDAAADRDRPVLAVPGPVRSRASAGTNGLLAAGCAPARDAGDVLVALGLAGSALRPAGAEAEAEPVGDEGRVLAAVGWEPSTLEQVAERLGVPLGPTAVHLVALERQGWVRARSGWYERLR